MARSSVSDPARRIELTERQEAVIRLIEKGLTNAEIADRLGVTLSGVKWHVREIIGKFGVTSRDEAVECWREHRTSGKRTRMWAGALWGSMAFRWVAGAAVLAGAGVAGTVVTLSAFQSSDESAEEPQAVLAAAPTEAPDLSSNQGLTLTVATVQLDETHTLLDVSLDGRQELGRLLKFEVARTAAGPEATRLIDDLGRTYRIRSEGGENGPRESRLLFEPVPEDVKWLDLLVPAASFVAPAAETALGERPPDASAVIDGPWRVRIHELPRDPVIRHALALAPQAVAHGTAAPFEVIQTSTATLLGIRFEGIETGAFLRFHPWPRVTRPDRTRVGLVNAGALPSSETVMWLPLEPTHGPVVVTIEARLLPISDYNVYELDASAPGGVLVKEQPPESPETIAARAALEALLAEQPAPEWHFSIP